MRIVHPLAPLLVALAAPTIAAQDPRLGRVDPAVRQGVGELQRGERAAAIATLDGVVTANPDDYVAWFYLGHALHAEGRLDEALRAHLLTAHLTPQGNALTGMALYNAACAHALRGRPERALQYLHRARNRGFAGLGAMPGDADLASLREDPRLVALAARPAIGPADEGTRVASVTERIEGGTGGVELGPDGTLYVADFGSRVWRIDPDGGRHLLAEGFERAADCTLDLEGNLLQVDHGASRLWRVAPDGTRTDLEVADLDGPVGVAQAPDGSIYVTSYRGQSILRVGPEGAREVVTEGQLMSGPNGLALAPDGALYVANYNDGAVVRVEPDGTQRLVAVLPGGGNGHLAWSDGHLLVTARRDNRIYAVTPEGAVDLVAGHGAQGVVDGGPAEACFGPPNGIAVSPDGRRVFVNDQANSAAPSWVLRRVTLGG